MIKANKSKLKIAVNEAISWLDGSQEAKEEYAAYGTTKQNATVGEGCHPKIPVNLCNERISYKGLFIYSFRCIFLLTIDYRITPSQLFTFPAPSPRMARRNETRHNGMEGMPAYWGIVVETANWHVHCLLLGPGQGMLSNPSSPFDCLFINDPSINNFAVQHSS